MGLADFLQRWNKENQKLQYEMVIKAHGLRDKNNPWYKRYWMDIFFFTFFGLSAVLLYLYGNSIMMIIIFRIVLALIIINLISLITRLVKKTWKAKKKKKQ